MLTYTIDFGNTFTKIAIFKDSTLDRIERVETKKFNFIFNENSRIIYSNVSKDFQEFLPQHAIDASKLLKNFKSTYDENKLGIDRKIISHYLQSKGIMNALLVDAGSFITFDEIRNGIHQGGPIYLGLGNYLKAYPSFSENLPLIDFCESKTVSNTTEAISKAFASYREMIKSEVAKYKDHQIIYTGGDAASLASSSEEVDENIMHKALLETIIGLQNSL